MRYLSVCSGIEAATVAWHPLGWTPVAFAEVEKFPSAVLAHHYPSVPNWGDITKFQEWPDAALDLLVGGTPCQSFSVAGLRKGLADPRGNLALTYLAIADRYRPEWLVWENVPGVLSSSGGRDFGAFLGGLVELGYGWAYRVLDAQYFGVAQRRRRVFVVASLGGWHRAAAVLFDAASLRGDSAPRRETRERLADTLTVGANQCSGRPGDFVEAIANTLGGASQSGGFRTTDLDNQGAFIPEVVGTLSDGAHMGGGLTDRTPTPDASLPSLANPLTARMGKGINTTCDEGQTLIPRGGSFDAPMAIRTANTNANGHGVSEGVAHTLDQTQGQAIAFSVKDHGADAGALSPTLRSGGHDKSHANGGVMPAVAFDARQSDVLQYGDKTGPLDTHGHSMAAHVGMQVRRLTPRECERLQGFSDDYTLIPYRGKPAADGPRYKALGNSMAVPCMAWIGRRIQMVAQLVKERAA